MPYRPPHWLETAASAIVPPAAAEHALGDITECSTSSRQYLRHLLSAVPPIVWSQIRRRLGIAGLVFSAMLAAFALLVSMGVPRSGFFAQSHPWLRLAAPWAVWVAGNALSVAYGRRDRPRDWNAKIFAATVIATLAVAAAAGVPVTRVAMAAGAVFAIGIVLSLPWPKGVPATPLTPQTLAEHARLFQKGIWWRNARETAAAVVVMAFNAADLRTAGNTLTAAGHLLLIGGTLFIVAYLYIRAGSRPVPREGGVDAVLAFHRREIARQRDILLRVPLWYLFPFVPGMAVHAAGRLNGSAGRVLLALPVVAAIFALIWALNRQAARWLDGQLKAVDALFPAGNDS